MNESSYGEYKRNLFREKKKRNGLCDGKIQFALGICLLLYTLWILPFHADNVRDIRGNEMTAGKNYYPEKVCAIEELQLLCAKIDDDQIYCIAKLLDCDRNDWVVSFTPGRNEELASHIILLINNPGDELDLTVGGYFLLESLEDLPFVADSFYSVYGRKYADADGQNMLSMNAEYLCGVDDDYTLSALFRPGIPLISLIVGVVGVAYGGILLLRTHFCKSN
ncbi:MAG: hypothetical protein NC313_12305 [Butyrivibrio sp.]|nr:hypothetical protein [Butyrivibrio sp.]